MRNAIKMSVLLCTVGMMAVPSRAELTDPYEILNRHYQAVGGIDKIKSQVTSYTEGTIDIVGSGLAGPFRQWSMRPELQRMEVELGPLAITQGNNGDIAWTVDQNGKLQIHRDELTVSQKKADSLVAEFAHLDPENGIFTLRYDGIDTAAGKDCYVLTMANTLTPDTSRQYYDTATFFQLKTVSISSSTTTHTTLSDFRGIDGVIVPFAQHQLTLPMNMVQEIKIAKVEVGVTIEPGKFDPPQDDVSDVAFTQGAKAENIPFRFIEGHIYLMVIVNGRERLWVLDSGAEMSCLEKRFAEELGVELKGEITGSGAGNLVNVAFATIPSVNIADKVTVQEQTGAVVDLYWLFMESLGMEVSGLLGYDFLSRVVTKVDYANQTLSFYNPDSFSYTGPGVVLDLPIAQGKSFEVPLVIDGEMTGKWYLDLGAGNLGFNYPYAETHGLLDRPGVEYLGYGAGGSFSQKLVAFKSVELAGFTVPNPLISVPRAKTEGALATSSNAGLVGNSVFRHFVIYLDYKHEKFIVEKGDDFTRVFPRDGSGMQIRYNHDMAMHVSFVAPNTPAATAGFQADDEIISVNGVDVENLNGIIALREMFRAAPGTAYDVVVNRSGTSKTLRLTLADLYL